MVDPMRWLVVVVALLTLPAHASAARLPVPRAAVEHAEPCPGGGGPCTSGTSTYGTIGAGADRFSRWHELGHVRALLLTESDRVFLTRLMRLEGAWDQGTGWPAGARSPSEWFADYHAACALGIEKANWVVAYAEWPGWRRYRRICNAISILALVRG